MSYSAVLRIKAFRDLWLGQAISQLGDSLYYVIFLYMVGRLTGNVAMVGVVGALESIPFLILGPYAGILADRIDRRKIMLLSDLISGFTLLLLAIAIFFRSNPPIFLLLATPCVLSSVRVFFMPAKSAAVPAIVPAELVQLANAFSSTTQSLLPLLGLGLSASVLGILFGLFPQWFFFTTVLLNALSFFGSAFFIQRLPAIIPDRKAATETHPWHDFKEGIRFMRGRRDLVMLTVLLTCFRIMVAPFFVVYVAANQQWFGGKPQPIVWWEFAFFSGMVISSLLVGKMRIRRPGFAFSLELAWIGVDVAMMGLAVVMQTAMRAHGWPTLLLGIPAIFWLFVLWNVLAGLSIPLGDVPINTYMQLSVPDAFRGRVNSVLQMSATGAMPIGMLLGGWLVARFGVEQSFLIMGSGMFLSGAAGLVEPSVRRIRAVEA